MVALILVFAQANVAVGARAPNVVNHFDSKPEVLGPGPHTLVIANGPTATRFDYRTGRQCQKARDAVIRQMVGGDPFPDERMVSRVYCVPR